MLMLMLMPAMQLELAQEEVRVEKVMPVLCLLCSVWGSRSRSAAGGDEWGVFVRRSGQTKLDDARWRLVAVEDSSSLC